jgi:hypothetical protein
MGSPLVQAEGEPLEPSLRSGITENSDRHETSGAAGRATVPSTPGSRLVSDPVAAWQAAEGSERWRAPQPERRIEALDRGELMLDGILDAILPDVIRGREQAERWSF